MTGLHISRWSLGILNNSMTFSFKNTVRESNRWRTSRSWHPPPPAPSSPGPLLRPPPRCPQRRRRRCCWTPTRSHCPQTRLARSRRPRWSRSRISPSSSSLGGGVRGGRGITRQTWPGLLWKSGWRHFEGRLPFLNYLYHMHHLYQEISHQPISWDIIDLAWILVPQKYLTN